MGGAAQGGEGVGGEVSVLPRPAHCRLRPEITGTPGKSLASVWDALKLKAQRLPLRPSCSQGSQDPAQTGVVTTYTHLEKERPECPAAVGVGGGGALWHGVGAPVHTLADPGRLLAAPALAAAQGVCGNDTARAAEIPPPDIGWKVEQLVRDNQWRSIAARLRRMVRGRGGGG